MDDPNNVLEFKKPIEPEAQKLVDLGLAIDKVVLDGVGNNLDLYEVGAVLSHRLGELVRHLPDETKDSALDLFVDIILRRADLL